MVFGDSPKIMIWIYVALFAYFVFALTSLIDKFILENPIPNPIAYGFYVGILSVFVLILAPLGLEWPGWGKLFFDIATGSIFIVSLIVLYSALKKDEPSRILTLIGGISPIVIFILSFIFLGERLDWRQILAFLFLIIGGVLISLKRRGSGLNFKNYFIFTEGWRLAVLAAVLFGIFYVLMKFVFISQPFVSGFIWTRIGSFIAALLILIPVKNRKAIFHSARNIKIKTGSLVVSNKILGGISFLSLNYAISLGSVTLINAMQGIQYLFLLALAIIVSKIFPNILKEDLRFKIIAWKAFAILFIVFGLSLLFIR